MDGYSGDDLDKLIAEADTYLGKPKRPKRPTFDVSALLDRIEPSVITQESSGKPNAQNPRTGALGLYQIMPSNLPNWTQKYVGRSMSPDEFLRDVDAQRKVFRGEFGRYLQRAMSEGYDEDTAIRRAAAGWYGGEKRMSRYDDPKRFRPNEPSFREYTTSILRRIQKGKNKASVNVPDDLASLLREADTFLQEPAQPQTKFDKQGNPVTAIGGEERVASEVVPQPVDEPAPAQYSPYALGKAQEALKKLAPAPQTPDNPAYLDYLKQSGMTDSNESRKAYNDALTNAPDAFRQPDPPQQQIRQPQPQLSVPNGLKPPPPRTQAQSGMVEPIRFTSDFANRRPNETFQQFFDREMLSRLRGRIPGATDYDIQRALDDSPTLDTEGQQLRESRYAGKTAGALEFEIKTDVLNRIEASVKRREAETRAKSRIDAGESDLDVLLDEQLISPESYTTAQYERQVEADNEKAAREKFLADNPTSDLTDPNFLSGVGAARFGDGSQLSSKVREQRPDTERLDDILRKYGSAQEYYKAQERIKEEYKYRPLAEPLEFAGNLARSVAAMPAYAGQFGVIALTDLNPWLKGVTAEQNPVYQALGGYRQWLEDQRNPDLDAWYVRDLPDGLGQLASQALLAPFTGGASVLLPIAQGAVEQYDAATKSNASNTSRNIATIVGGLAAVPEVLLNVRYIGKALPDNQVTQLITGWAEKLFGNLAKVLPEAEARQLTSRTIGAFLQQGVRNGVLGAATEYTQERAEDTVNKLVAKLSYKPEVSWTDVFVPNSDEQRGYLVAGIIGAFGGNINLAIQKMSTSELQKSDEVIAKALREGRISQENAETLAREVADEARRRNVNLSPTGTVEQLVKNATDRFFAEKEASRNKVASGVFQTLQPITAPATAETEQETVTAPETAIAETIEPQTATVEPMVEPSSPTDVIAERPREMGLNITPKAQTQTETPINLATKPDGKLKTKAEYTDDEWRDYTRSVIDYKLAVQTPVAEREAQVEETIAPVAEMSSDLANTPVATLTPNTREEFVKQRNALPDYGLYEYRGQFSYKNPQMDTPYGDSLYSSVQEAQQDADLAKEAQRPIQSPNAVEAKDQTAPLATTGNGVSITLPENPMTAGRVRKELDLKRQGGSLRDRILSGEFVGKETTDIEPRFDRRKFNRMTSLAEQKAYENRPSRPEYSFTRPDGTGIVVSKMLYDAVTFEPTNSLTAPDPVKESVKDTPAPSENKTETADTETHSSNIKFATKENGELKTKREYSSEEWQDYTQSVITSKLAKNENRPTVVADEQITNMDDLRAKYGDERVEQAERYASLNVPPDTAVEYDERKQFKRDFVQSYSKKLRTPIDVEGELFIKPSAKKPIKAKGTAQAAMYATTEDSTRFTVNGAKRIDGGWVATDGHMLLILTDPSAKEDAEGNSLYRAEKDGTLTPIDGWFPNYEKVIPHANPFTTQEIEIQPLIDFASRTVDVARNVYGPSEMSIMLDLGAVRLNIAPKLLLRALQGLQANGNSTMRLKVKDDNTAAVLLVTPKNDRAVLMPMRENKAFVTSPLMPVTTEDADTETEEIEDGTIALKSVLPHVQSVEDWDSAAYAMRESVMAGQPLFAKRDRDRTARLNETLPYETELHKVVENIESKFDDNGELELNEYASETIRRVLAEISNDPYETSFDGVTIPQAMARKIANRIRGRIKAMDKAGYDVAPITQLVENLDKLATAKPFGIVYVFDDVLPEERVHVEDLTLGRTDSKAIAELKQSPIWAKAQSGRFSKEYGNQSEANQISEIAAKLATDQSAKYGWTGIDNFEAEKTKFLNTWADGVLRGNESTIEDIGAEAFIASYPTIGKYGKVTTGDTKGTGNQRTSASADETRTAKEDDSEKQTQADERFDRDTEAAQSDTDRRLPADGKLKKRQFAVSMAEQLFDIGDVEYEAQTEKGWSEKAIAKVEELGTDKAIDEYRKLPANESAGNKTALGIGIAIDLYQKGDFKQLTDFGRELTENIGNAAQELRAAALLSRLSPVFAEAYAERIVRRNLKRAATEEEKTAARVLAEKLADLSNKVEITQAALEQQTAISKDFEDAAKEIEQMLADERDKVADEKRKNRNLTAALKRAKDATQRIKTPRTRTPAQNKALRKQIEAEKASLMDIIKRSLPGNVLKSVTEQSDGSLKSVSSSLDPQLRDAYVKLSAAKMIDEFGKPLVDAQGNKQNDPFTLAKFDEWLDGLAQQSLLPDDRAEIHAMAYDMIRPQRQTIGMDASQRTRNRMEHAKAARKIIPDQQADAIKDRKAYRRDKFAQAMVETARDMGATPEETYMAFGIRELGDKRRLEPEFKREFPDANFDKTLLAGENIYKETKARLDRARIEMREGRKLSDKELFDIKHADKLNRGAAYNARRDLERYYRELAKSTGRKAADRAFEVLGLPKTLMSTGEVSFALRQGFIPFLLFNKEWREGTKGIVKGMSDPTKRIAYEQELRDDPYFTMAEHYGVAFNQIGNRARIDEHFPTKFIEDLANADTKDRNIAAVGAIKAARLQQRFEHAYTLPGDAMRLGLFKNLAQVAEQSITDDSAKLEQAYKYAAYIANISVGKGSVEKVFGTDAMFTRFLNTIGFAPGYLMSRIEAGFHYSPLGIAVAYSRGGAGMAKQMARKSMRMYGSLAGAAILMQGLIAGVSGAGDGDKEPWYTIIDPNSPNFMKLRWPNGIKTDITANLSDWGKLFLPNFMASGWHAVQEAAGNDEAGFEKAVDVWGKDWNKFFGSWRYWRGKLSPTASAAAELYDGKTYLGRPITPWGMITSRTAPLTYQQAYDAFFYDPAEQFMREPETFKRGVDRLMDLNNESLSGMGKRAANSLTLFGLAGVGIGAQQYERFERSPAEEKAASIYSEIAGGGKSGRKSDEQRRIEAGLRDLFRYRDQLADKGKDTQWVTDAIKRYAQKYNVPADVRTELKDQAQTSSLKFYTQRMTAAQVREVLKYATFEEQSELLDIIKKKESNEERRKAKGAK